MGAYVLGGQGNLTSRMDMKPRSANPPSPGRHCFVDGKPSLLVEWGRVTTGWEGRVISVLWVDAEGWATGGAMVAGY